MKSCMSCSKEGEILSITRLLYPFPIPLPLPPSMILWYNGTKLFNSVDDTIKCTKVFMKWGQLLDTLVALFNWVIPFQQLALHWERVTVACIVYCALAIVGSNLFVYRSSYLSFLGPLIPPPSLASQPVYLTSSVNPEASVIPEP